MYEFLLSNKLIIGLLALGFSALAAALVGSSKYWWRGLLFSLILPMAVGFYAAVPFSNDAPHGADVAAGLIFEFGCLGVYYWLFRRLVVAVGRVDASAADQWLKRGLIVQVLVAAPNLAAGGFGIFSDGSRIEYLYAGSLPIYLTYAGLLISAVQVCLIAARISASGKWGWWGLASVVANFIFSVVAGSKGAVFLWLLAIAVTIEYRRARISKKVVGLALALGAVGLVSSAVVISDFIGIELDEFANLALNRFFLYNDARALAFDLRSVATGEMSLLTESFRSISSLIGSPARNEPLGVLLYQDHLFVMDGSGANASLMALITYYSSAGYALLPAMIFLLMAVILAIAAVGVSRMFHDQSLRLVVTTLGAVAVTTMSQDFLAFQVMLLLIGLALPILFVFDRRYEPRRSAKQSESAPVEHRHSGYRRRRRIAPVRRLS